MEVEPSIPNVAANQCRSSWDVVLFLTRSIDDNVKYQILTRPWTPLPSYSFPYLTSRNLRFQLKWMERFPFLSYTEVQGGGAFCRYCVFFAQGKVGKHVNLGKLVAKPLSNFKKPYNHLLNIPGTNFIGGNHASSEFHIGLWKQEEMYFRKPRFR